jgi:hypothetical protein
MNRSRLPVIILLILSFLVAGFAQELASYQRNGGVGAAHPGGSAKLAQMDSYALALLLGGLRGPLVMFLWPSEEEQKHSKNLEDFDTKIEWIRLLQAEFDTVHLFQIWNKAFNISAQMANLGNKYRTILDALDYAHSVDAERPNDISIIETIGQIYFDKLGNSTEKIYYREKIREQSQARQDLIRITFPPDRQAQLTEIALDAGVLPQGLSFVTDEKTKEIAVILPKSSADLIQSKFNGLGISYTPRPRIKLQRSDPGWHRTELDPILDAKGNILPEYLIPKIPRPANLDPKSEWDDGSELQYLKQFEPYPYGVSSLALAYNYYKRAQVLETVNKQRHAQLSGLVVDSRPGIALKGWCEDEWERGRRAECAAFEKPAPAERLELESATASVTLDSPIAHIAPFNEAIYSYQTSIKLIDIAIVEYLRHLSVYQTNIGLYLSHMDGMRAEQELEAGDLNFLLAMKEPAAREEKKKLAIDHYREALKRNELMALQYYTPDEYAQQVFPHGVTRASIVGANLSLEQITDIYHKIRQFPADQLGDDFAEYTKYVDRAQMRLKSLEQ